MVMLVGMELTQLRTHVVVSLLPDHCRETCRFGNGSVLLAIIEIEMYVILLLAVDIRYW